MLPRSQTLTVLVLSVPIDSGPVQQWNTVGAAFQYCSKGQFIWSFSLTEDLVSHGLNKMKVKSTCIISVLNYVWLFNTHLHLDRIKHAHRACFHLPRPQTNFGSLSESKRARERERERASSKSWLRPGRRSDERVRYTWTGERTGA